MPYALVGSTQATGFGIFGNAVTANLPYPGGIAAGDLAIAVAIGRTVQIAGPTAHGFARWSAAFDAGTTAFDYKKILDGTESGTIAMTNDAVGGGLPTSPYIRVFAVMVVLRPTSPTEADELASLLEPQVGKPFPQVFAAQTDQGDTDEVIYMGTLYHSAGGADAGWEAVTDGDIAWDAALTVLTTESAVHSDTQSPSDGSTKTNSFEFELAVGDVVAGTHASTSNSMTWTPLTVTPSGPSTTRFIRSVQDVPPPLEVDEAYWGILATA